MKRDMDLVRYILTAAEEAEPFSVSTCRMATASWDSDAVGYHAALLVDADLIKGEVTTYVGDRYPSVDIDSLTWSGHDFLDSVRDDTVWNQTKAALLSTAGTAAMEVVKALAVSISRTSLGLPPA